MRRSYWFYILILGLGLWVLYNWSTDTIGGPRQDIHESASSISKTLKENPTKNFSGESPNPGPGRHVEVKNDGAQGLRLSANSKNIILKCVSKIPTFSGVQSGRDFETLEEFLEKSRYHQKDLRPEDIQIQNLHVKQHDGRTLRLQIVSMEKEESTDEKFRVQMFEADEEGFPVQLPVPQDLRDLSPKEALDKFAGRGEKVYQEKDFSREFDDLASGHIIERDGRIEDVQIFFQTAGLHGDPRLSSLTCAMAEPISGSNANHSAIECRCL